MGSSAKIEFLMLADLRPYARNSRTHDETQVEQLAAAMQEFGFTNPIIVGEDGTILAGHGRVQAVTRLYAAGQTLRTVSGVAVPAGTIPGIRATGLTDAQMRALVIEDNASALAAGWDMDLLRAELAAIRDEGSVAPTLLGFTALDLKKLLAAAPAALTDEDDVPELDAAPVSKLGDMWLLGAYFECDACNARISYDEGKKLKACPKCGVA